jgi:hypothetical protein
MHIGIKRTAWSLGDGFYLKYSEVYEQTLRFSGNPKPFFVLLRLRVRTLTCAQLFAACVCELLKAR